MKCKQVHKLLPDYIDNNLSDDKFNNVRMHIENCNNCSNLYDRLVQTMKLLQPKAEISEQPFYFTRLKQRMENKIVRNEALFNIGIIKKVIQPLFYLTSLIIAVYIGILIGSNSSIPNKFSKLNTQDKNYIEEFAEYNYLNDLKLNLLKISF